MSLQAINEQLLRTVRTGVAVFDNGKLGINYSNKAFDLLFGEFAAGTTMAEVIPGIDTDALAEELGDVKSVSREIQFRRVRRTMVLTLTFSAADAGGKDIIIVECQNHTRIRELETMIESYSSMVERNTREIQREKENVERLLLNIMPRAAYEEFKSFGVVAPQRHDHLSVLVLDFLNFSETMQVLPAATFVTELNELFTAFDQIGQQFGLERIKSTGGVYVCTAGMNRPEDNSMKIAGRAGHLFSSYLKKRNMHADTQWQCRIGLGSGMAIGSVVGVQKYVYDVFGPAVDSAMFAKDKAAAFEILVRNDDIEPDSDGLILCAPENLSARQAGLTALSAPD